jgi:hypothetical protein
MKAYKYLGAEDSIICNKKIEKGSMKECVRRLSLILRTEQNARKK